VNTYRIRGVTAGDAHQLGTAHVAIWKATYAGLVDQAKLDALHARDRIARWTKIIADIDQQAARGITTRCAVDVSSDRIVGFATGGSPRDSDPPATTELWSLNVLPRHHGRGVSADLMAAVIGQRDAYLWVATGNARAIAFYRKHRFELDGATRADVEWDCHESRMVRTAPPGDA
jgi:ribosomal protein S18 acetylase RimI-like enzyme